MSLALDPRDNWRQQAASLISSGMPIREASRAVGKSEYSVRWALDVNGERAKHRERVKLQRERHRAAGISLPRIASRPNPLEEADARIVAHAYCKPASPAGKPKPTLPAISLPMLAEPPRRLRLVTPAISSTNPGAERWRSIHRALIRAGKLPDPSITTLVSEFSQ